MEATGDTERVAGYATSISRLRPLIGFVVLVALLAVGLNLNPRNVPSPLIGRPAPTFSLPQLAAPEKTFSPRDMLGKVWLLNVWASWCVFCRQEHPMLIELAKRLTVPLVSLNYKEVRGDGAIDLSTGDFFGRLGGVKPGSQNLRLLIDQVQP